MTKLEAFCKGSAKQEALLYSQTLSLDITSLGLKSMTGMVREGFVVPKLLSVGVRLTLASGYAHVHFAHNCQTNCFSMLCTKPWMRVRAKITGSHLRVLCLWPSLPSPDPRPPCCWSACSSHPFLSGTSVMSCIGGRYLEYLYQIPKPRSVWYQIPRSIWCQIPEVYDTKHLGNRHTWQQIPKGTWQQIPKSTWQLDLCTWYKFVDGPPTSASFFPSWMNLSWNLLHYFCHLGSSVYLKILRFIS